MPDDAPTNLAAGPVIAVTAAGGLLIATVPMTADRLLVGRTADVDVRLESTMVSRHHAELARDPDGRWWVRDLGSRNGTAVNGQPATHAPLRPGDRIQIADFVLTYTAPCPDPSAAAPAEPVTSTRNRVQLSDARPDRISTLGDAAEPPRLAAAHLVTLNDLGRRLLDIADADARRRALCALLVGREFQGRWAAVLRVPRELDADPDVLAEAAAATPAPAHAPVPGAPYVSRGVLRTILAKGEPVLASNVRAGGSSAAVTVDVELSIAPTVLTAAAIACVLGDAPPLPGAPAAAPCALDVLYVVLPPQYGTAEWLALLDLAAKQCQQADAAWVARRRAVDHAALERELQRAREIQMRLVPAAPRVPGLDVTIGFVPCHWVGGDYVDVVPLPDGRVLLAVADVCGKGLPAALVASSLHTMVRASIAAHVAPAVLMANLNAYLRSTLVGGSFVTMVVVALDPATGQLECINAGHPAPLVLSPSCAPRELPAAENLVLGILPDAPVATAAHLAPGETLALYTDGLTELTDPAGNLLGTRGLERELAAACAAAGPDLAAVARLLTGRLDAIHGPAPATDDRTFLLARLAEPLNSEL